MSWFQSWGVMTTYRKKSPSREMHASGVCDALIYCRDHRCSPSTTISADR
jgi:hypothetical protein